MKPYQKKYLNLVAVFASAVFLCGACGEPQVRDSSIESGGSVNDTGLYEFDRNRQEDSMLNPQVHHPDTL